MNRLLSTDGFGHWLGAFDFEVGAGRFFRPLIHDGKPDHKCRAPVGSALTGDVTSVALDQFSTPRI
ncbi:MAG: hypothetical protein IID46_15610 [Planctomycetes bacterium]|nr:hypothetical protein [Planctomycetota bacterium]